MTRQFVIADQNAVSAEGHFQTYTNALACAAQGLGCDVTVLWNKRFPIASLSATYRMAAVFSCTEAEAAARNVMAYGEGHFGFELERALAPLGLGAQDHVVIHTCHYVELAEALDYLALLPPTRDLPNFHIVVRYDPDVYRYRMRRLMQRLGAILRTAHLRDRLRLHSDTQQLATEFSRLFGAPVDVCPIPVDLDHLLPAAAQAPAGSPDRPLIATYLGTARSEKGYRDILDAVAFLRKDYISTDRLHFVLQCSDRSINGEPGLADYQRDLEAFIAEQGLAGQIRLIKHLVEQEEYCALVARSDIVLLAYSPESYRHRSSSVLIEAMATGKVVVTRQGSWMASRVGPDNAVCYADPQGLGPALAQAIERFEDLNRGAKARQAAAIVSGNPTTLAEHFLQSAPPPADAAGPITLMIGNADEIAAGNLRASVFRHRLACCVEAGGRVAVALVASRAVDNYDSRRRIADALRPYPLEGLSVLSPADRSRTIHGGETPAAVYLAEGVDEEIVEKIGLAGPPVLAEIDRSQSGELASRPAYPFPLQPAQIDALAGPVDGFELVASGDPLNDALQIQRRPFARMQDGYQKLFALESVDLLLHGETSETIRWFLEKVYEPLLAERRVTVLVVREDDALACAGDVLFVGAVADRTPLYAAAKLVATTTTPGQGASLPMMEALARAKPLALFDPASGGESEGFEVHRDAARLADAIIELLESPHQRTSAAELSYRTAVRLGAGEAREAFLARLTPGVAVESPSAPSPEPVELVEWSPCVRAANRFVRSCLANEPLDGVKTLAAVAEEVDPSRRIAQALFSARGAPLLRVDGGLLARIVQRRAHGGAAEIVALAGVALGAAGAGGARPSPSFVVNRRFPTEIQSTPAPKPQTPGVALERMEDPTGFWRLRDEDAEGGELVVIETAEGQSPGRTSVRQTLPLDPDTWALGRLVFANWRFDDGGLLVQQQPSRNGLSRALSRLALSLRTRIDGWSPWTGGNQLFDDEWYAATYPDAARVGLEPFRHYGRSGAAKGYKPHPFFDADWYARRYGSGRVGAWRHYLDHGHEPHFDPGPHFSAARYRRENPDVSRNWQWSPLLHYTLLGRGEERDVYPAEASRPHQSLALPVVVGKGAVSVEFVLDGPAAGAAPFTLHVDGRPLEMTMRVEDGRAIARADLPREAAASGLVDAHVTLERGAPPAVIRKLRTRWTSAG